MHTHTRWATHKYTHIRMHSHRRKHSHTSSLSLSHTHACTHTQQSLIHADSLHMRTHSNAPLSWLLHYSRGIGRGQSSISSMNGNNMPLLLWQLFEIRSYRLQIRSVVRSSRFKIYWFDYIGQIISVKSYQFNCNHCQIVLAGQTILVRLFLAVRCYWLDHINQLYSISRSDRIGLIISLLQIVVFITVLLHQDLETTNTGWENYFMS